MAGSFELEGERLTDRTEQGCAGADETTAEDDRCGIDDAGQVAQPERQPPGEFGHDRSGLGVVLAHGNHDVLAPHVLGIAAGQLRHSRCLAGVGGVAGNASQARPGGIPLPTASPAAPAGRAMGVDHDVPDLAGEVGGPAKDPATGQDAAADAGAESDEQHVALPGSSAVGALAGDGTGGVVVDRDDGRRAEAPLQLGPNFDAVGGQQIRGKAELPTGVHEPGDTHPDGYRPRRRTGRTGPTGRTGRTARRLAAEVGEEAFAHDLQVVDEGLPVVDGVASLLDQDLAVVVEDDTQDLRPADVYADGWRCS